MLVCLDWAAAEAGLQGLVLVVSVPAVVEAGRQRAQSPGSRRKPLEDEQTELPQQQNHAGPPLRLCLFAQ